MRSQSFNDCLSAHRVDSDQVSLVRPECVGVALASRDPSSPRPYRLHVQPSLATPSLSGQRVLPRVPGPPAQRPEATNSHFEASTAAAKLEQQRLSFDSVEMTLNFVGGS